MEESEKQTRDKRQKAQKRKTDRRDRRDGRYKTARSDIKQQTRQKYVRNTIDQESEEYQR